MSRHAILTALFLAAAGAIPALAQTAAPFDMPRADEAPPATGGTGGDPFRFPDRAPSSENNPLDELLNNMLERAQPHLEGLARDMGGLFDEYAPVLEELGNLMDDIGNYEMPPERLANGDILIRRKAGAPPPPPLEQLPNFVPKGDGPQPPAQPGAPVVTAPDGSQIEL